MILWPVNPRDLKQVARALSFTFVALNAPAAIAEPDSVASVSAVSGPVKLLRTSGSESANRGANLSERDGLETGPGGVVQVKFKDGSSFTLYEKSSIRIDQYKRQPANRKGLAESAFDVLHGKLKFFVNPKAKEKANTQFRSKTAIMGIRGTSGVIDVAPNGNTQLVVLTGVVEVKNPKFPDISVAVTPNFSTRVESGVTPQPPKPVSKESIQNLVPAPPSDSGFTDDGPSAPPVNKQQKAPEQKNKDDKQKNGESESGQRENEKKSGDKMTGDKSATDEAKPTEKKSGGPVKPLFAPGGEVINKSNANADSTLLPAGKPQTPASSEGGTDAAVNPGTPEAQNRSGVISGQAPIPVATANIIKELEKVTSSVSSTIEKTREMVQPISVSPVKTPAAVESTPQPQRVKVKINLPRD